MALIGYSGMHLKESTDLLWEDPFALIIKIKEKLQKK